MQNILFISHKEQQCGVYQFGKNIANALRKSRRYNFIYAECSSAKELLARVNETRPEAIIYNYYPSTLPWLKKKLMWRIKVPHIGIMHEVTQQLANDADDSFFQYYIAPDPTLLLKNPIVFKTGRLVLPYTNSFPLPESPTIGSFGFGTNGKGFERLISTVQNEFDSAIIRLHIPFAAFGDCDGREARAIAQRCKAIIVKPGIKLFLSHEFLDQAQLMDFLARNSINAFFYDENKGRGISSVIDYALAVNRPIIITKSTMFRHISSTYPSICVEDSTLKEIINNGVAPIRRYKDEWCEENLIWDYERVVEKALSQPKNQSLLGYILKRIKKTFQKVEAESSGDYWVPNIHNEAEKNRTQLKVKGFKLNTINTKSFNRILDQSARDLYRPIIDNLFDLLPDMMSRKMPEANIQQGFVLDTAYKFLSAYTSPRTLCIGSYDDTAAAAIKILGYVIDEVDPVLNYDLNTFCSRPSTLKESYDIIFSTSVLEHVRDDELFLKQVAELLAPGGVAIFTVDFNDQYKPGDRIPHEDFRLYTQKDFKERLLPLLKDCSLVNTPQWDCTNPDFTYAGCRYTFATFVFRKNGK